METNDMAKLYTVTPIFTGEELIFVGENNKQVQFVPLRDELDVRGGFESREVQYLYNQGVKRTVDNSPVIEFTEPWTAFQAKYNEGKYELLQGNSRFYLLTRCETKNLIELWQSLKAQNPDLTIEQFNSMPEVTRFAPINFKLVSLDPNNPDDSDEIKRLQLTTNNAVKSVGVWKTMQALSSVLQRQIEANDKLPKEQRLSVSAIRERVAASVGMTASRTFHAQTLVNFVDRFPKVASALDAGYIAPDTVVKLVNGYSKIEKEWAKLNGTPSRTLEQLYNELMDDAMLSSDGDPNSILITPASVDSALDAIRPVKEELDTSVTEGGESDSGDDEGNDEGEGTGDGAGTTIEDIFMEICDKASEIAKYLPGFNATEFENSLMVELENSEDSDSDCYKYAKPEMKKILKNLTGLSEVLPMDKKTKQVAAEIAAEQKRLEAENKKVAQETVTV